MAFKLVVVIAIAVAVVVVAGAAMAFAIEIHGCNMSFFMCLFWVCLGSVS